MAKTLRSANLVFQDILDFHERSVDATTDEINTMAAKETPVRTGRAQRGWRARRYQGRTSIVIENRVPYIGILDRRKPLYNPAAAAALAKRRSN